MTEENSSTDKKKVLIVEDHFINKELLKEMLDRLDCTVDIADNGKEALEHVNRTTYDIIFMDLQMPEMDGYEATENIRKKEKTPIIALTANIVPADKQRCFDVGMNDYISKPFEVNQLEEVLLKYTNKKKNAF